MGANALWSAPDTEASTPGLQAYPEYHTGFLDLFRLLAWDPNSSGLVVLGAVGMQVREVVPLEGKELEKERHPRVLLMLQSRPV